MLLVFFNKTLQCLEIKEELEELLQTPVYTRIPDPIGQSFLT